MRCKRQLFIHLAKLKPMADTLYIIGNGFDLHHGLRTSYTNFRDDYARKKVRLWDALSTLYGTKVNEELWWTDFEEMLGEIDYDHLTKSYNGEALSASKVRNLLKGMLPSFFGEWIKGVKINVEEDKTLMIDMDALYFTFNYTLLLEHVYHVKDDNVWHIHNSVRDVDNIIVGHDSNYQKIFSKQIEYSNANPQVKIRTDIYDWIGKEIVNGAKKVKDRIKLNEYHFSKYSGIKHIIAMGFSFNNIDMPYIVKIWNVISRKDEMDWNLYWHSAKEIDMMKEKIIKLGVNEGNINMVYW